MVSADEHIDPRIRSSRHRALKSTIEILATEGLIGLTQQNIARKSGVARATVYRHWPTREHLVVALLEDFRMPLFIQSPGDLRHRLCHNVEIQLDALMDARYLTVYTTVQSVAALPMVKERLHVINVERVKSLKRMLEPHYLLSNPEQVTDVLALMVGPLLQCVTFIGGVSETMKGSVIDSVIRYLDHNCIRGSEIASS